MKGLVQYLQECGEGAATPTNTIGAGNPILPGPDGELGSGDTLITKEGPLSIKKRKRKKITSKSQV